MSSHLHLLGGSGRIGTALVHSLTADPIADLTRISIYCDSTKITGLAERLPTGTSIQLSASGYAAFPEESLLNQPVNSSQDRHIVINMRGVNNKHYWLNQPLDAMDLQMRSCRSLIDSNLWMQPGCEIIHFSSQLCDLIESPASLKEICQGQESYRRPYMVSRLHQEALLAANAYQHGTLTSFIRLPAVYGFADDSKSPWVLNSLCKQKRLEQVVSPRNPDEVIHLCHRLPLIAFLRSLLQGTPGTGDHRTVRYLRTPMLQMTVETLANLVRSHQPGGRPTEPSDGSISLLSPDGAPGYALADHYHLLTDSIASLLHND